MAGAVVVLAAAVLFSVGGRVVRYFPAVFWGWGIFAAEAALSTTYVMGAEVALAKVAPLVGLAVLGAWMLVRPQGGAGGPLLNQPLRWLVYYAAWIAFCALLAPDVLSALTRAAQIAFPLVVAVAARRGLRDTASFLVAAAVACLLHVLYAVIWNPNYVGLEGLERLTGLLIPNAFGYAAGLAAAGAFGLWLSRRGGQGAGVALLGVMAVCGYAMVESAARTAAVAIVAGTGMAIVAAPRGLGAASRRRTQLAAGGLLAVAVFLIFQPRVIDSAISTFARGNTEMGSLTGRIPLWERLLTAVADRPIAGYGPAAYRDHEPELIKYLTATEAGLSVAHNAAVEAAVAGGLTGGLLWVVAMVALARHVWRTADGIRPFAVAVYAVTAVTALTTSAAAGIGMGWFVIGALAILPVREEAGAVPDDHPANGRTWAGRAPADEIPGPVRRAAGRPPAPVPTSFGGAPAAAETAYVRRVAYRELPPVPPRRRAPIPGLLSTVATDLPGIPAFTDAPGANRHLMSSRDVAWRGEYDE